MKFNKLSALMIAALSLSSISAFAGDENTGEAKQALGEQCSVIATYKPATDGCGGPAMGDIQVDIMAQLQAGKVYDIEVEAIDENDTVLELAYSQGNYSSTGATLTDTGFWAPPAFGKYQLKLRVFNHFNRAEVCSSSSPVIDVR